MLFFAWRRLYRPATECAEGIDVREHCEADRQGANAAGPRNPSTSLLTMIMTMMDHGCRSKARGKTRGRFCLD